MEFLAGVITGIAIYSLFIGTLIEKYQKKQRNKKQKEQEKKENNKIKGNEYEEKCALYFEKLNYKVNRNGLEKRIYDQGIDLIVENEEEIILVQCKNYIKSKLSGKDINTYYGYFEAYKTKNNITKKIKYKMAVPSHNNISMTAYREMKNYRKKENIDFEKIFI